MTNRAAKGNTKFAEAVSNSLRHVPSMIGVHCRNTGRTAIMPRQRMRIEKVRDASEKWLERRGIAWRIKVPENGLGTLIEWDGPEPESNTLLTGEDPREHLSLLLHCHRLTEFRNGLSETLGGELAGEIVDIIAYEGANILASHTIIYPNSWFSKRFHAGKNLLRPKDGDTPNLHWDVARFVKEKLRNGVVMEGAIRSAVDHFAKPRRTITRLLKKAHHLNPDNPSPPPRGRPKKSQSG